MDYNIYVIINKWPFIFLQNRNGTKNKKPWKFTDQSKMTLDLLHENERRFQIFRIIKKTEQHNEQNFETWTRNFKTFTWWSKQQWLKMQSKTKSSKTLKNENYFKIWSGDLINSQFVDCFSLFVSMAKVGHLNFWNNIAQLSMVEFLSIYFDFLIR